MAFSTSTVGYTRPSRNIPIPSPAPVAVMEIGGLDLPPTGIARKTAGLKLTAASNNFSATRRPTTLEGADVAMPSMLARSKYRNKDC